MDIQYARDNSVSYCGLVCFTCPIYLASREEDEGTRRARREEIAKMCNEIYHAHFTAGDITDCDGCRTIGGKLFSSCLSCEIRDCARGRGAYTCAECSEFPCARLENFLVKEPAAKERLLRMRSAGS